MAPEPEEGVSRKGRGSWQGSGVTPSPISEPCSSPPGTPPVRDSKPTVSSRGLRYTATPRQGAELEGSEQPLCSEEAPTGLERMGEQGRRPGMRGAGRAGR
ncbi:hypothetical protein KIL84_021560 [Mauremys mutica]|uniref:Uncharacterized protein n=1 Tax=Mauremys mutica TaxID=74926 RepID=A0A9D3X8F5_9SAUR|nr:hypothetical protein KIL84_021560 [Mauremys mutica]